MALLDSGRLEYDGVSFPFGRGTPFRLTNFVRGVPEGRFADRNSPRMDGRRFGRDFLGGATHQIGFLVEGPGSNPVEREAALQPLVAEFERVWAAAGVRQRGGALAALTLGDKACFGRPREVVPDDSGRWDGVATYVVEFAAESASWFSPPGFESVGEVKFVPPTGGGLTFLAEAPFTFDSGPTVRNGAVTVGGDVASWPVFEIHGPVTNPIVEIVGAGKLVFDTTLAYDQVLEIDTRPWARWMKRNGAAFPGALSPAGDRLADMSLQPGAHQVVLRGHDPTGTSFLRVRVASAFTSF